MKNKINDSISFLLAEYKRLKLKEQNKTISKEEKEAFTLFHRLIFNLKRLIQKLPGGSSKLASYVAGLFLIKEEIDVERLLNEGESYVEELLQD